MKYILCVFVLFAQCNLLFSQTEIRGTVTDEENNTPISGATVYVNNSTIRTSTDGKGSFILKIASGGSYELVISALGYELKVMNITEPIQTPDHIGLTKKIVEIEEVAISPFLKDGWQQWGSYFTDSFIGTSQFSKQTKIENPEVLRFRFDKKSNILTVSASEPLKIMNKALGYRIDYDLHAYSMDFGTRYLYYEGYASFQEVKKISRKMKKNREEAYMASLLRFVRSTYRRTWEKDGYEVRELIRQENTERTRVDSLMKLITKRVMMDFDGRWQGFYASQVRYNADSIQYFRTIQQQPKVFDLLGGRLTESDISTDQQVDRMKEVVYANYLYIMNLKIQYEDGYFVMDSKARDASLLSLIPKSNVWIDESGNFSPPANWIIEGYFAWYNKLGTLLPLDYEVD